MKENNTAHNNVATLAILQEIHILYSLIGLMVVATISKLITGKCS